MARKHEVGEHPVEIKIDKVRRMIEQVRAVLEHDFKGREDVFELLEQLRRLRAPLIDATAAKLPFFVPQETELV